MSSTVLPSQALAAAIPASAAERRFNAAQKRLAAAFATLDAEIARQRDRQLAFADQIAEFGLLQTDRTRLALEVENFRVRAARLEDANRAAAGRFANAAGILRDMLHEDELKDFSAPDQEEGLEEELEEEPEGDLEAGDKDEAPDAADQSPEAQNDAGEP